MTTKPNKGTAYRALIGGTTFIALDIETTNQAGKKGEHSVTYPISVGAVVFRNGTRRDTFHVLVNPGVCVDKESSEYNGITTKDLAGADAPAVAFGKLDTWLAQWPDVPLLCHHGFFDITHLAAAYDRAGMDLFDRTVFDTQVVARRLHLPDLSKQSRLVHLIDRYGVKTTVGKEHGEPRLCKGLLDAQNTAEVLGWLMAEAAQRGIVEYDVFAQKMAPKASSEIAASVPRRRRRRIAPTIPTQHIKTCHSSAGLPDKPTHAELEAWVSHVADCVALHCPNIGEKVTIEMDHGALLRPLITGLIARATKPGDIGTLLVALDPLIVGMDRAEAREWWKRNRAAVHAAPPCEETAACPACVQGWSCPQDSIYKLLTRRVLDYGGISLFSDKVAKDLYEGKSYRKIDTWPRLGMADMAAHMMFLVVTEARRKRMDTKYSTLLRLATRRGLAEHDPWLALEVAKHWAKQPGKQTDVEQLMQAELAKATTEIGYRELDTWYHDSFRKMVDARTARLARAKPTRGRKLARKTADIEKRPLHVRHTYRYQLRNDEHP